MTDTTRRRQRTRIRVPFSRLLEIRAHAATEPCDDVVARRFGVPVDVVRWAALGVPRPRPQGWPRVECCAWCCAKYELAGPEAAHQCPHCGQMEPTT